jgi:hypothetical protein
MTLLEQKYFKNKESVKFNLISLKKIILPVHENENQYEIKKN